MLQRGEEGTDEAASRLNPAATIDGYTSTIVTGSQIQQRKRAYLNVSKRTAEFEAKATPPRTALHSWVQHKQ